jgi:hypothetical protein
MRDRHKFSNKDELQHWLEDKPVEWSQALSARSTLRCVHILAAAVHGWLPRNLQTRLLLCVLRVGLVSTAASFDIAVKDAKRAARAAAAAANNMAAAVLQNGASTKSHGNSVICSTVAYAAADAARTVYATTPINAASYAIRAVAADTWRPVSDDARQLDESNGEVHNLLMQKLWHGTEKPPRRVLHNRQHHDSM